MSGEISEFEIIFSPTARKQLAALDSSIQTRVKTALIKICKVPPEGDIMKLTDRPGQFRLRVGDWRIIYRQLKDARVIEIVAILR